MLSKFFNILIAILITGLGYTFGQNNFLPNNLGGNINSQYTEINPIISPDGKTLYFIRADHPENHHNPEEHLGPDDSQDVWFSKLQADNSWGPAKRLPAPINTTIYNAILSISDDGNTFLINGVFDKKGKWIKRGLSLVEKTGESWTKPVNLKLKHHSRKNKGISSNSYLTSDSKYLFLSYTQKFAGKKTNLYISKKLDNNTYGKPHKLPKIINSSKSSEEAPFYHSASKRLYFSSNQGTSGKNKNNFDIYYTQPLDENFLTWSAPVKMSDTINTAGWESYFKTNAKGSMAYFASSNGSKGSSDIFKIKIFEENPYIVLSGKILNKKNNKLITPPLVYEIYSNDALVDSLKVNPDSATYWIKLRLGKVYTIKAVVKNFTSIPVDIDVTKEREYIEKKQDLFVEPLPYVLLTGKILIKGTNTIPPPSSNPRILVDGTPADSVEYDPQTGIYKLKINHGKAYNLSVKATGYNSIDTKVDLTAIENFEEISKDLPVQKINVPLPNLAIVTGRVLNGKTMKPIDPSVSYKIEVNNLTYNDVIVVNKDSASYELQLELGKNYLINALSENYYPVYEMINLQTEKGRIKIFKDLVITPIEVGQSIKLNNIFFETGKFALKKQSFPELDRVVKFLSDNPSIKIQIEGHTDNVGNAASNQKLSQGRAGAVTNYLIKKGIAKERITSKGFGMSKPVASNKTKQGKSLNRRVVFTILEK